MLDDNEIIPVFKARSGQDGLNQSEFNELAKNSGGNWIEIQKEQPLLNETKIVFTIPAGALMVRIQGLIVSPALLIQPAVTFNDNTNAIYNRLKINTTSVGDLVDNQTNQNNFQFTSSFANGEVSIINIEAPIFNGITRQVFKGIGFNNGGTTGDFHTTVGWANNPDNLTSMELITPAPFANGFAPGSFFIFSVLK